MKTNQAKNQLANQTTILTRDQSRALHQIPHVGQVNWCNIPIPHQIITQLIRENILIVEESYCKRLR